MQGSAWHSNVSLRVLGNNNEPEDMCTERVRLQFEVGTYNTLFIWVGLRVTTVKVYVVNKCVMDLGYKVIYICGPHKYLVH